MPSFGTRSRMQLNSCHSDLQKLFEEVIKHYDCTILEGHRTEDRQNELYAQGKSKVQFPDSKHNSFPSLAVDAAPYPIDWDDTRRFYMFVGIVRGIASQLGINIRCGADWDGDLEVKDQNFHDLPHFEIDPLGRHY